MTLTEKIRLRDSKVAKYLAKFGQKSLREIGKALSLSKDSVSRSIKSFSKRNKYPESYLWETEEGKVWLHRMYYAAIYEFGIKGNQGADRLSEFFKRINVNKHIGVSPSVLRDRMQDIEKKLAEFQEYNEKQEAQKDNKKREITAAGDEAFFDDTVMLVLMDMASGYLVVEEEADNRSYETWKITCESRLEQLGLKVRHFVSDRGKSLIKLATDFLKCRPGADLFHAQFDISKWLGRSLNGKLGRAYKTLKDAEKKLLSLEGKTIITEKLIEQKKQIKQYAEQLNFIKKGRDAYREAQLSVSAAVHAFSMQDNQPQTSRQIENHLEDVADCFESIAEKQSTKDTKNSTGKFRRQIKDASSIVDTWWLWNSESLFAYELNTETKKWILYTLLPVIYWYTQRQRTQNPEMRKVYEIAWEMAHNTYKNHPFTDTISKTDLEQWQSWGEWACGNFHRTSSAVEGRNGCLAQSYHNCRGMTIRRRKALTAIHNYDTRRRDGTTPAQRLYGEKFEDMFEWLIGQMSALPLARKNRNHAVQNPLKFEPVLE